MKRILLTGCSVALIVGANFCWADTYSSVTVNQSASIYVHEPATVVVRLKGVAGTLNAGVWGEGSEVATMDVDIINGGTTERPAARWTESFPKQTVVTGCDSCRNVESQIGVSMMPLKLTCVNASTDGEWLYATTAGTSLSCSIAVSQQAIIAAGNYTISLDAAMRTQ